MDRQKPLSVLVVEDDETAREILMSVLVLKFPHIPFHAADNGKSGLAQFITHSPAIVITDINMPVMDGIRMAEEIKSIAAGVKLIVLTAFGDRTVLEAARTAGIEINYCLLKPVDYGKLFTAIEQCLAE
jgi:YesN/AraC family two-component response regulator